MGFAPTIPGCDIKGPTDSEIFEMFTVVKNGKEHKLRPSRKGLKRNSKTHVVSEDRMINPVGKPGSPERHAEMIRRKEAGEDIFPDDCDAMAQALLHAAVSTDSKLVDLLLDEMK